MQKMTIHRALAELKLIDSKIEKQIAVLDPTGVMQEGKLVNGVHPKDTFVESVKSSYQSVTDLIERKVKIKSAIVAANATTIIEVAGKKMSIADAITFKQIVLFKRQLVESLTKKHNTVKAKFTVENEKVRNIALENAKIMIGKVGDNGVKPTDDDVKQIVDPYVKRNEFHFVDPIGVEELTKKLQSEVDQFELEIDAVLSEINAITIIEI